MTDLLTPNNVVYCKSSIKPPGGLFISSMFEGRLNRGGGGGGFNNLLKWVTILLF